MTRGNTPNIVLRRMLRYFVKILQLKKIFQFQERICFLINNTKTTSYASVCWGNTKSSFKENAKTFS